jgi:hypothetical protein
MFRVALLNVELTIATNFSPHGWTASQMKKSCDCCKRYVGHLDETMKCFCRHMAAESLKRSGLVGFVTGSLLPVG